ncbi:MAG: replication-associated recombination protein A [Phycisphaerales bacterium]|nr:replication-associated recombination protein A [Phycisphaerales bacterium]
MSDLWAQRRHQRVRAVEPLAVRMRPRTLDEFAGQQHILGEGKLLRRMIAADKLTSLLLYGPPGTGKTTLAEVIARVMGRPVERENASSVGVARIREIIAQAERRIGDGSAQGDAGKSTILFLDEIHRFSKSQQDVLLGEVERGVIILVGATTENPLFAVNSALVSRSTLLRFEPLTEEDITGLLRRAIGDKERGYGNLSIRADDEALAVWARLCDGDARRALTALEVAVLSSAPSGTTSLREVNTQDSTRSVEVPIHLTRAVAEESIQQKAAVYDGSGDEHYDTISAMIKSVRGSDPDAAVYWMARMLDAGEDPRFIARRLAILASEDIGNADPRGIMVAEAAWSLTERVGMPECRIILSQCAIYLALAPKSNASYLAIDEAMADVKQGRTVAVPVHIKDGNVRKSHQKGGSGKGEGYRYAHDAQTGGAAGEVGGVTSQDYLGVSRRYYRPTERGVEKLLKERLDAVRAERDRLRGGVAPDEPQA